MQLLSREAGGWEAAAMLPAEQALDWAQTLLRERQWDAYKFAYQAWASALPAFAWGGSPPDPPDPPEDYL